ncbi:MAG: FliM/FliN family flagellar motor switch protein [Planctomycetota bacterium]
MNEILTNEEIDTLLDLFRAEGGELDTDVASTPFAAAATPEGDVASAVDLLKPNRVSREHMRALERAFESASKAMTAAIGDRLRMDIICDCVATEQMRFQSWIALLTGPVAIYSLAMPPLEGPILLAANTSLLYGAVDRILGGSGRIERVPSDFTAAEYTVADAFITPCVERICDNLREVVELTWSIEGRVTNPSMAQVLPGHDVVVCAHFQISGEALIGDLRLAIPFLTLERYLGNLNDPGKMRVEPGAMREPIEDNVRHSSVPLQVNLGETTLQLRQLLGLSVGDVIPLRTRFGEPLAAPVQGRVKFRGQIGTLGRRLGFRITEVVA